MNKRYFYGGLLAGMLLAVLSIALFLFILLRPPEVALKTFRLRDLNNQVVNTDNLNGKPTVVNFWATWCGPCLKELPDFLKAQEAFSDSVNFIYISDESIEIVSPFLTKRKFNGNFYCNAFPLESIGLTVRPTTYFYDRNGNLCDKNLGDMDYNTLIKKLRGSLAGNP